MTTYRRFLDCSHPGPFRYGLLSYTLHSGWSGPRESGRSSGERWRYFQISGPKRAVFQIYFLLGTTDEGQRDIPVHPSTEILTLTNTQAGKLAGRVATIGAVKNAFLDYDPDPPGQPPRRTGAEGKAYPLLGEDGSRASCRGTSKVLPGRQRDESKYSAARPDVRVRTCACEHCCQWPVSFVKAQLRATHRRPQLESFPPCSGEGSGDQHHSLAENAQKNPCGILSCVVEYGLIHVFIPSTRRIGRQAKSEAALVTAALDRRHGVRSGPVPL
jgi:hypothetical protein